MWVFLSGVLVVLASDVLDTSVDNIGEASTVSHKRLETNILMYGVTTHAVLDQGTDANR